MPIYKIIFEDSKKYSTEVKANDEFAAAAFAREKIQKGINPDEMIGHTISILNTSKI